ncbi:MAG: TonB-dependent receptor [Vicinamibacterales bacterium]
MNRRLIAMLFLACVAMYSSSLTSAQERFGRLTGIVTDQQNTAVPGVTVTVTNTESGAPRVFVTDTSGRYNAQDLQPGRYIVSFELAGFSKVERPDITVQLGRAFELDAQLRVGALTEVVQVTGEAAPLVDTRSTTIAHNVSAEEFDRLPKARSFQSIALSAPSVNQGEIEGGFQVNGASGAENSFTVDGTVTNSLVDGRSRQNTVFEYLQEVQVKTSGISAEFGGALGGVISAVTKSGGNVFRGEAHYYFAGSALSAAPVKRLVLNPQTEANAFYVQDKESPANQNEFGGSIGGPIVKDRLFFFGAYSPRRDVRDNPYNYSDNQSNSIKRTIWTQQAFGKLTYAGSRYNVNWSTLWTPTKATGTQSAYDGATPNGLNSSAASQAFQPGRGYEVNQVNTNGMVDITLTNTSFMSVRGGFFHDRFTDTGIPSTTSFTYLNPSTAFNSQIPANIQGGTNFVNTPRSLITEFDTTKRSTFDVNYNKVFSAGGLHQIKGGYGFQHVVNDINSFYPGGFVQINWGGSFTFGGINRGTGTYGYYEVNDRRTTNKAGADIHSLFIQDDWNIGSKLTLNLGLRTEDEKVPTFRPDYLKTAIHFNMADKLAPRLGAAYDVFGDGKLKVFGSWGMYYDWTKYELPRGSFGAETWCISYRSLDTLNLSSLSLANMPGRDLWQTTNLGGTTPAGQCRDRRVPSFADSIDPDLKPMRQSSTSAGLDFQLGGNSVLTVHYIHNDLLQTIEDLGVLDAQGNEVYVIGNPGKGDPIQPVSGATGSFIQPKPKRQYDALELGWSKRFSNNYFFSANYTLSRLYGNYAGLASSDEIRTPTTNTTSAVSQQQGGNIARVGGNVNRAWDLDELLFEADGTLDVLGRLATDRPHVLKLYGAYDLPTNTQIGAFIYAGSGTPMSTYVVTTNQIPVFVEGRGDMGRTPVYSRTDLLLSQGVNLGSKKLRLELNVQNLFNQKTTRHVFNYLNKGAGAPRQSSAIDLSHTNLLAGYNYNALILASPDGANAKDVRYGMADLFEQGTNAYVTLKFEF